VSDTFLAFDLGAESGRAIAGTLRGGTLVLDEIRRFHNEPVATDGSLRWDVRRLWSEMRQALEAAAALRLASVAVDAWGVDYALLGERGELLENPYHYRDVRTNGMMAAVFDRVSRARIYAITGIQFLPINTLYQVYAACRRTPDIVAAAQSLATIPDLMNYWLAGQLRSEYTIATTTQMVDARAGTWADDLLNEVGIPRRLLTEIVAPGAVVGTLQSGVADAHTGTPVVAPACHDTGSAVASVSAGGDTAFLSSGTWSLLGTETTAPVISARARDLNFTNEGGVCGTIRVLKNIAGLWLLQACRRSWAAGGQAENYDDLLAAADARPAFTSLVDPDHSGFLNPVSMPAEIGAYCQRTSQPAPADPPAFVRAILESLALKYRLVLEQLEELTGRRIAQIRVVGGGSRNRRLNQFTADATGRTVIAGPVEATALGNIGMQMLAVGAVRSIAEARAVIERSFPVERFEPSDSDRWDAQYRRFADYVELTCA
jgi:rhamnulokinase